ncbi:signal transduction histidine kinase [Phycicoccus badiiscoriae]|uniref:histidine kinase n=1 Tax=Pedococcus badiiscoriae TaxID=642776 RepID=A0A852WGK8_9MICO|nr:signal transduction histidine kinase [Pedococcus badiiscoriae]
MDPAVVTRMRLAASNPWVVDGALAGALSVVAQVQLPGHSPWWVRVAMLATTASLAWRRAAPLPVSVAVAGSVAIMGLTADPPSVFGEYLAVMLAAFTVAECCRLRDAAAGLGVLLAGIVAHDWRSQQFGGLSGFVSDSAIPVVIWLVGRAVHLQRSRADRSQALIQQLEVERQELAHVAVAAERAHLARELHDVVTHSISLMVIQAQGARRVLGDKPEEVSTALEVVESAGRETLTEMRRLLGLLREEDSLPRAPQPGLADLPHLLDQVRSAGLPVTVTQSGTPGTLHPGIDLAAYRIVQEALTNSLKHARPATARVEIAWQANGIEVSVTDTGEVSASVARDGRGLLGMRERIAAYGGEIQTGPAASGGFRVWCRLPGEVGS